MHDDRSSVTGPGHVGLFRAYCGRVAILGVNGKRRPLRKWGVVCDGATGGEATDRGKIKRTEGTPPPGELKDCRASYP